MLTAGHQQAPGELLELEPLSSFSFPGLAGLLLGALSRQAGEELGPAVGGLGSYYWSSSHMCCVKCVLVLL